MSYLIHHGVKGQQWGVQNGPPYPLDSSVSTGHRLKSTVDDQSAKKFSDAVRKVHSMTSNKYTAFVTNPINISNVEKAAKISHDRAEQCTTVALKMHEKARTVEPKITADIVSAVKDNDCKMHGLENRLKQPESIARKLATDSIEKGLTLKETEKTIGDAIRYTVISNERNFVENYTSIRNRLEKDGYAEIRCRNYFSLYKQGKAMHKSVVSKFITSDGQQFEVQFQTPSSQASKELRTPLYEERRQIGVTESRAKELEQQMVDLAERVKNPPHIFTIGDELKHSAMIIYKRR